MDLRLREGACGESDVKPDIIAESSAERGSTTSYIPSSMETLEPMLELFFDVDSDDEAAAEWG